MSLFPDDAAAGPDVPEQGPPMLSLKTLSRAHTTVDYEFGKAFDKQDADHYFGGMPGVCLYTCCMLGLSRDSHSHPCLTNA